MANKTGIIFLSVNGEQKQAKGSFTYNLGKNKRETIIGADGVHGFKETPQAAFIEGMITDSVEISVEELVNVIDATVTIQLNNGKVVSVEEAAYVADGDVTTEEGEIQVRFEGKNGREFTI